MPPGPFSFLASDDMASDTDLEDTMRHDLHLRWLRMKRHLRTFHTSRRAVRDAERALRAGVPPRSSLCRRPACPVAA